MWPHVTGPIICTFTVEKVTSANFYSSFINIRKFHNKVFAVVVKCLYSVNKLKFRNKIMDLTYIDIQVRNYINVMMSQITS